MYSSLGPKLLGQQNIKGVGTKSKNFPGRSLEVIVSGTIPFSTLDSRNCGFWQWEKAYHILDADSKHILSSGEPRLNASGCCHLIDAITLSSKGHSIFLSVQLLQDGGKHSKIGGFHDCGLMVALLWL